MWITLHYLCLITAVICNETPDLENAEVPKQSFLSRRAIDGTRGRKYYNPEEDGSYDSYGSSGGQYNPDNPSSGYADIRSNVPGEPEVDYPAYRTLPPTSFSCEGRQPGYYADEDAGCQVFHVCHSVKLSSFLCPIGSIFNQKLLTCDWWNKVDCATTQSFYSMNQGTYRNANEMVQKAYTMMRLPQGTDVTAQSQNGDRKEKTTNFGFKGNELPNGFNSENTQAGRNYNYDASISRTAETYDKQAIDEQNQDGNPRYQNTFGFGNVQNHDSRDRTGERISQNSEYDVAHNYHTKNRHEDSPIIYIQKSYNNDNDRNRYQTQSQNENDFPNTHRHINVYPIDFQPSYAPTVPTVTSTTRKLYSPTVPTTYRPSTIAYNKFDQDVESSDHLYTRTKDVNIITTPPTIIYQDSQLEMNRENDFNVQQHAVQTDYFQGPITESGGQSGQTVDIDANESIGIAQSEDHKLRQIAKYVEEIAKDQELRKNDESHYDESHSVSQTTQVTVTSGSNLQNQVTEADAVDSDDATNSEDKDRRTNYESSQSYETRDRVQPMGNYQHYYQKQLLQGDRYESSRNTLPISGTNGRVSVPKSNGEIGNNYQSYYNRAEIGGTSATANENHNYDYNSRDPTRVAENLKSVNSHAEDNSNSFRAQTYSQNSNEQIFETSDRNIEPNGREQDNTVSITTTEPIFMFAGQHQKPSGFMVNQDTTRSLRRQFSTAPTTPRPTYNSDIEFGSRLGNKAATITPVEFLEHSEKSEDRKKDGFWINVQDPLLTNENKNFGENSNALPTWNGNSGFLDNVNEESITVPNVVKQTLVPSRLVAEFTTTEYGDGSSTISSFNTNQPSDPDSAGQNIPLSVGRKEEIGTVPSREISPPLNSYNMNNERRTMSEGVSESTVPPLFVKSDLSNYKLFKQASNVISPFSNDAVQPTSTVSPVATDAVTKKSAQYNSGFQFTIRNALTNAPSTISPFRQPSTLPVYHNTEVSSTTATGNSKLSSSTSNESIRIDDHLSVEMSTTHHPDAAENPDELFLSSTSSPVQDKHEDIALHDSDRTASTTEKYLTSTPRIESWTNSVQNNFGGFKNSAFEVSTLRNSYDRTIRPTEEVESLESIAVRTTTPKVDLPENLSQIEASIANNNNSPYQVSLTVNKDEGFNPTGDFISRLISQHESNDSAEATNLGNFEVVKSEPPGVSESIKISSPISAQNFEPIGSPDLKDVYNEKNVAEKNLVPKFDSIMSSDGQRTGKKIETGSQNLNFVSSDTKIRESSNSEIASVNSDNFPRPFSLGNTQSVEWRSRLNSGTNDLSIINPPSQGALQVQKAVELSNYRTDGKDISGPLESLFGSAPRASAIYPPLKDQILDDLTKNFGEPLYNGGQRQYFGLPDERRIVDFRTGLPLANLQQYQAGRNLNVNKQEIVAPVTPEPTTTTTKPVKTVVKTEFVPSLGFSFDTDEGRKEYVEAVLHGLLTNNQSVDPWSNDAPSEKQKSSKSSE